MTGKVKPLLGFLDIIRGLTKKMTLFLTKGIWSKSTNMEILLETQKKLQASKLLLRPWAHFQMIRMNRSIRKKNYIMLERMKMGRLIMKN
jgi:hypothetical protein